MAKFVILFLFFCLAAEAKKQRECSLEVCGTKNSGRDHRPCMCDGDEVSCVRKHLRDADICLSRDFLASKDGDEFVPREIILADNDIQVLEKGFVVEEWKTVVTKIDFSDNAIDDIDDEVFVGFSKLGELDLEHNKLERLDHMMFAGLYNLHTLDLRQNRLKKLKDQPFQHLEALTALHLSDNPIEEISGDAFDGLDKLQTLVLDGMRLKALASGWGAAVSSLLTLSVTYNYLNVIPDMSHLSKLKVLSVNGNPIEEILEGDLTGARSLEKLEINHMPKLYVIGKNAFKDLEDLDDIEISNNKQLQLIDEMAFGDTADIAKDVVLTSLILRNNSLVTLSEKMLDWRDTSEIDIRENAWECDCRLKFLQKLDQIRDEQMICAGPADFAGYDLKKLPEEDLPCDFDLGMRFALKGNSPNILLICVAIVVSATLLAAFLYFVVSGRKPKLHLPYAYRNLAMKSHLDDLPGESDDVEIVNADSLKRMSEYEEDEPYPKPVAL